MRILLDTCIVHDWMMGWIVDSNVIRPVEAKGAYVSAISALEISIKPSPGKLALPQGSPARDIEEQGFMWFNVTPYHAERVI